MKILSIETSCDETALAIVEANGGLTEPYFSVLGNALLSQIDIHKEYGGVFPALAKREHSRNLIPLLKKVLESSFGISKSEFPISKEKTEEIKQILSREPELLKQFLEFIPTIKKPDTRPVRDREGSQRDSISNGIDLIAVTSGPGLEPALWVGINFARALGEIWDIPVVPVNHMEGHIASVLLNRTKAVEFPILSLLISGGHTELVTAKTWGEYRVIGQTRDDAVGEAFDKVARLLDLPYPGGPEISKLAKKARQLEAKLPEVKLPRPMLKSDNYDFSFSGLKTAVLYTLEAKPELSESDKQAFAREFENAVTEVLTYKTKQALEEFQPKTLILGGGVTANMHIREAFKKLVDEYPEIELLTPNQELSTDNAIMIAMAGYLKIGRDPKSADHPDKIRAQGSLSL